MSDCDTSCGPSLIKAKSPQPMKARSGIQASCLLLLTLLSFTVRAQLKADFQANQIIGCAPLVVHFSDQSAGEPTQWKWDLGNGTISLLQNPSVSYFNPGQYSVKLVVSNDSNTDSIVKIQYITVSAKPSVEFTASATTGCFPLPVTFKDQSTAGTDTISHWQWDFGDGLSSSEQNPSHTYTTAGNYNVTLRVINSNGCLTTLSKTQYIQISAGVMANFTNSVPKVCSAPVVINFQNQSSGTGALSYEWLFGDGTSSSMENPSHTYTAAGTYTLQLIVTNITGCTDTIIKPNGITVGNVSPAFTVAENICANSATLFSNTSTPKPVSVVWNFGDGTSSTLLHPNKKYTVPGTYQVKMLANFGSCTDSALKTITVAGKPTAVFTADDSTNCTRSFTVKFTNQATDAISYQWNFGDNTTSALPEPTHTYQTFGNYTVQLVVTNTGGCTDTLRKINYIKNTEPQVIFKNLADSGCVPFTKTFQSSVTSIEPVAGYLWNFGDGSTSTEATPTHTYNNPGVYPITLIITTAGGCTDTAVINRGIIVNSRPVAKFSATPRDGCAKTTVNFTDESVGSPIKWLWDFGDGATSKAQNPGHIFNDTGYFEITLIVWNTGCSDTIIYKEYIHVKPPIARYAVASNCNKPYERIFTDKSIGADDWSWNFGDGVTSTEKNPVHTYSAPGAYTVSLTVRNNSSGCDFTNKRTIQVIDVTPSFYAADTIVCKGNKINFTTNISPAEVNSFKWNFGNGIVVDSTSNIASHTYKNAGNYTVQLITTDILGCKDTLSKAMYIRIDGPTAKFSSAVAGSCLNSSITFNDQSTDDGNHPIQSWKWNYADGIIETQTAAPYQHNYTKPGAYKVGLTVTDSRGCTDSFKLAAALIISQPAAKFKTTDTATCPGKPVSFTNQSTGPGLKYRWDFGDNTFSTDKNPVHTYLFDGNYSVKLHITDQYGCTDSLTRPEYINITTSVARFNMSDSFSTCPPLIVQFTNLSVNAFSQVWDFGDGTSATVKNPSHFYSYPGIYTVSLTIKGSGGCVDVMKKDIVIKGPTGSFTYNPVSGCNPVTVNFVANTKDRSSFIWDFNNGVTAVTTDSVISHTYTNQGTFRPKMILIDSDGCQVPITGKDSIQVSGVIARLHFLDKVLCDAGSIAFADSSISNDVITRYNWSFGDGSNAVSKNPQHQYMGTGLYYPKLVVTTKNGCTDSITSAKPVKIVASPKADLNKTPDGCTPLAVTMNGIITAPDTSAVKWNWDFSNGQTSSVANPPVQNYSVSDLYNVKLTVTNSSGCADTVTKIVNAYVIPAVNAGPDTTICQNIGVKLVTTGAATYSWNATTGLDCYNCDSPLATPDSVTNYIVKGTSLQGCSARDTVEVKVKYPFKMKYSKAETLCKGQDTKLFATGTDRYEWSPSPGLNNAFIENPVAQPDTTTNYRVVGTDYKGCFRDTGYVALKVFPIPTVYAGEDKTINVGQTVDLVPVISPDVSEVIWSPTGAIFRNDYPAISVKPNTNTEYTVEVKNRGGCMTRDKLSVLVLCNGTNVFIPNTFSPNGDGANDIFYPRGTGLFKIKTLRIYNRWGEKVFEKNSFNANDPSSGWDGTYKGVKLPADVFVYMADIICDNNSILPYKGNVALIQ